MTQLDVFLRVIKPDAVAGMTAEEIHKRAVSQYSKPLPQYNRIVSDLRADYHVIVSWRRPEPVGTPARDRFYYCGQVAGGKMFWWELPSRYPQIVEERAREYIREYQRKQGYEPGDKPEQMTLGMAS